MWAISLIAFAMLAVGGALLLGWGIPFIVLFGAVFAGVALFFVFQRTAVEPTAEGDTASGPSWTRKHWWQ